MTLKVEVCLLLYFVAEMQLRRRSFFRELMKVVFLFIGSREWVFCSHSPLVLKLFFFFITMWTKYGHCFNIFLWLLERLRLVHLFSRQTGPCFFFKSHVFSLLVLPYTRWGVVSLKTSETYIKRHENIICGVSIQFCFGFFCFTWILCADDNADVYW